MSDTAQSQGAPSAEFMDALVNGSLGSYQSDTAPAAQPASTPAPEPNAPPTADPASNQDNQQTGDQPAMAAPNSENTAGSDPATGNTDNPKGADQPDINDLLLRISGGSIKSEEDLRGLLDRQKQTTDLQTELESLRAQSAVDPFANDYIKKLNDLYKGGATQDQIHAFNTLNQVGDLKKLEPLQAMKLALRLEHGGLSDEEAETYVRSQYKLDPEEHDEGTVNADKVRLRIDAKKAVDFLEKQKAEVSEPPAAKQQKVDEAAINAYKEKATPIVKEISKSMEVLKGISVNGKSGKDAITVDLNISDASKSQLEQAVAQFATAHQIPLNEQGVQSLRNFATSWLAVENWQNWLVDVAAKTETRIRAEYHNSAPVERGQDNPNAQQSSIEKAMAEVAANY